MPTIPDLSPISRIVSSDNIPLFDTMNGDSRKASVGAFTDYIRNALRNDVQSITAAGSPTSRLLTDRFADNRNLNDWASLAVGNDWTNAINTAIETISSSGFGTLNISPGTYLASQIVLKRGVILSAQSSGSVLLKQIALSNKDFIVSENFSTLNGSNKYATTYPEVPYWYGLNNIWVSGNFSGGNTSGRGVCFYGNAMILSGINMIGDTADTALYTEGPSGATLSSWFAQEEAQSGIMIIRQGNSGKGWHYRGPHNSTMHRTFILLNANSSDYGFHSENAANYKGITDNVGQIHTYSSSTNLTNRRGMYIGSRMHADYLSGDASSIVFAPVGTNEGHSEVARVCCTNIGKGTGYDGLTVSDSSVRIGYVEALTMAGTTGGKCIDWTGANGSCDFIMLYDNSGAYDGASFSGGNMHLGGASVQGFTGAGRYGIQVDGSYNSIHGKTENCAIGLDYVPGGHNRINLEIYANAGQTPVSGSFGVSDRVDIQYSGASSGIIHHQRGTLTNDNAIAGCVGEYKEGRQTGSLANFPTSGQYGDNVSVTLTPGDWDVSAIVNMVPNGATITQWYAGVGTATGNSATGTVVGDNFIGGNPSGENGVTIPTFRALIASTTVYYLKVYATYAGGPPQYKARISARRIR